MPVIPMTTRLNFCNVALCHSYKSTTWANFQSSWLLLFFIRKATTVLLCSFRNLARTAIVLMALNSHIHLSTSEIAYGLEQYILRWRAGQSKGNSSTWVVSLVREECAMPNYANKTMRVADWYTKIHEFTWYPNRVERARIPELMSQAKPRG